MSTLTIYLARLIGLSVVLLAAGILVRGNALIMATAADGPVMLVYAASVSQRDSQLCSATMSGLAVPYR